MSVINYGAIIEDLTFIDLNNQNVSLVLKRNTLDEYIADRSYLGAVIGRFCNRIENGRFELNGVKYQVTQNQKGNLLHGGEQGFNKKVWQVKQVTDNSITLFYQSVDGEEGFPGNLDTTVKYTLTSENKLQIEYFATTDKDTIVNFTNHTYFNVNGIENTTEGIELQIDSDNITAADSNRIPHGDLTEVRGTLFDFNQKREFNCDFSGNQILSARGHYDENFVLNGQGIRRIAQISSKNTGIVMQVITDQPCMQVFSGNSKGIALETQGYPNSINCPLFPSPILRKGEVYKTITEYAFSLNEKK
jgi:aldose 1-epimerase